MTLIAFATNSLFCRIALKGGHIDAAAFTFVRLLSGAVALVAILKIKSLTARHPLRPIGGTWPLALFLFGYAAAFSFAYLDLNAATGGLILFGSVQATMVVLGTLRGERPGGYEWTGLIVAVGGLAYLLLPRAEAPSLFGGATMAVAGVCWGCYSIYGKGSGDPVAMTAGNFLRSVPFGLLLLVCAFGAWHIAPIGLGWAVLSGAVTSGIGYVLWYDSLKWLTPTRAAVAQLTVPIFVAVGGGLFLGETLSLTLLYSGILVISGASLAIFGRSRRARA